MKHMKNVKHLLLPMMMMLALTASLNAQAVTWVGIPLNAPGSTSASAAVTSTVLTVRITQRGNATVIEQLQDSISGPPSRFLTQDVVLINNFDYCVSSSQDLIVASAMQVYERDGMRQIVNYLLGSGLIRISTPTCKTGIRFTEPITSLSGLPVRVVALVSEAPSAAALRASLLDESFNEQVAVFTQSYGEHMFSLCLPKSSAVKCIEESKERINLQVANWLAIRP
jgi:hypothetical protein